MPNGTPDNLNESGSVLWITGLSGSGKTTLAKEVSRKLRKNQSDVVNLDGDTLREAFTLGTSDSQRYVREERLRLAMQYARLCKILSTQGFTVVIATISMFKEVYAWNRSHLPGYFEVYLKAPVEELRRRDSKSIYSRFDAGELHNVAGLDLDIDEPERPDFLISIHSRSSLREVTDGLIERYLSR